ncbi:MAG: DNA repair protein RadC [Erysipelotrichia bacterium]|nr:DNA repair protein RadC [Erysipelotrichia bacterium]
MSGIKNWDKSLRPREKALNYGISSLSDCELLALILRCGNKGKDAISLATDILNQCSGISGLMKLSLNEMVKLKGIGLAKSCELKASMELVKRVSYNDLLESDTLKNPHKIVSWLQKYIGNAEQEFFVVIFLNNRNVVVGYSELFKGTGKEVSFSVKNIFSQAIKCGAEKIIMAHNHPSQFVSPSLADDSATKEIVEAGELMDIPLVDHIIISYNDYYSYREKGVLQKFENML